jgi:hypothetical protein
MAGSQDSKEVLAYKLQTLAVFKLWPVASTRTVAGSETAAGYWQSIRFLKSS